MNRLVGYRKMVGYTQINMADMIGIHPMTYHQKENKKRRFTEAEKVLIHKVLKNKVKTIDFDQLWEGYK